MASTEAYIITILELLVSLLGLYFIAKIQFLREDTEWDFFTSGTLLACYCQSSPYSTFTG